MLHIQTGRGGEYTTFKGGGGGTGSEITTLKGEEGEATRPGIERPKK